MATGRKWNWMFGQAKDSSVRMKPPASKWLLAPMPVPANSHSAPMAGWLPDLRRGARPGAQQYLAAGMGLFGTVAAAAQIGHTGGAAAVEENALGERVGQDGQVRTPAGLVQIAPRGAGAAAARRDGA